MISPTTSDRFGLLLKETRERLGLLQEDIAERLGVDRSLISQWERGVIKRPVAADDVNRLAAVTGVSVLLWVRALGYDVMVPGVEADELDLLEAYRQLPPAQRELTLGQVRTVAELLRRRGQG